MLVYVFEGMLIFFLYKPGIHDSPYSPGRKGLQCFDLEFIFCVVLLCSVTSDQIKHGLLAHPMLLNLVSALVILTFLEFTLPRNSLVAPPHFIQSSPAIVPSGRRGIFLITTLNTLLCSYHYNSPWSVPAHR